MVVGVTGGTGVGKSVFIDEMRRLGARVVRADDVARRVVRENPEVKEKLRKAFGDSFFDRIGRMKRRALAVAVFSDPAKEKVLNRIVWPSMLDAVNDTIRRIRKRNPTVLIVLEMAVLFETRFHRSVDRVVTILAPLEKRKEWLARQRQWTDDEICLRIRTGGFADNRLFRRNSRKADWVVENRGTQADLRVKAGQIFKKLCSEQRA